MRYLLTASIVSEVGSSFSLVLLPIFAVSALEVGPVGMAVLAVATLLPGVLVGLLVSPVADRSATQLRTHRFLEVTVGVTTLAIPAMYFADLLGLALLAGVVAIGSALQRASAAFRTPAIIGVVGQRNSVAVTGYLTGLQGAAVVGGQALAGALLRLISIPVLLVIDGLSSIFGAALLEPFSVAPNPGDSPDADPVDLSVTTDPPWKPVRTIQLTLFSNAGPSLAAVAFVSGVVQALSALHFVDTLGIGVSVVALAIASGALAGLIGGAYVEEADRRLGRFVHPVMLGALAWAFIPVVLVGGGPLAILVLFNFEVFATFAITMLVALVFGGVQRDSAPERISQNVAIAYALFQSFAILGIAVAAVVGSLQGTRSGLGLSLVLLILAAAIAIGRSAEKAKEEANT